jgi:hypothetical protein
MVDSLKSETSEKRHVLHASGTIPSFIFSIAT